MSIQRTIKSVNRCRAFTLLEVMIIVALIGLLAAVAMPTYSKVRKQAQGRRIVSDARIIDTAIDTWAVEHNKSDGAAVAVNELGAYIKTGALNVNDVLGNPYGIGPVGASQVRISAASKAALSSVQIDWGAY